MLRACLLPSLSGWPPALRAPCRTKAHAAVAVADHGQRGEAEQPSALHDLRDAIDRDELLDELVALAVFPRLRHMVNPLKFEAAFAGGIGQRFDAAVIT